MTLGGSGLGRSARLRRGLFVAVVGLVLGGLGFWWVPERSSFREPPPSVSLRTTIAAVSPGATQERAVASHASARNEPRVNNKLSNATVASRTAPMRESSDEESPDELRQPHPITPQHQRIFEENSRIGAMNYAMDRGDFAALRRLNSERRQDYPEDADLQKEAYDLIADCLEQRTPPVVAAARRFWQAERASSLRRYVRRHCLEGDPQK
jgi:hypothetical protein